MYTIVFSTNNECYFFLSKSLKFLSSLIALARISNTMVIEGILISFPILAGKLLSMILAIGFFNRYLLS